MFTINPCTQWSPTRGEKLQSMEFAFTTSSSMDSSTTRRWITCTTHHYLRTRRSTFPRREWFLPAIVPWLLEDRHSTNYSVTTKDAWRDDGWKWPRKKPRRTIMIPMLSWCSPMTMIDRSLKTRKSISMNSSTTKMDMRFSHFNLFESSFSLWAHENSYTLI